MSKEISDKDLLNVAQSSTHRTYAAIAKACGTSEYAVRKVLGLIP